MLSSGASFFTVAMLLKYINVVACNCISFIFSSVIFHCFEYTVIYLSISWIDLLYSQMCLCIHICTYICVHVCVYAFAG